MGARRAFGRMKRIGGSIALGAVLVLGSTGPVAADTFGELPVEQLVADAFFVENVHGIQYNGGVIATRDLLAGTSTLEIFYTAEAEIQCGQGVTGIIFINFYAVGPATVEIDTDLGSAEASARVRGTEFSTRSCGDSVRERSQTRVFKVELNTTSHEDPNQFVLQQCVDFEDGAGPVLVTQTNDFRPSEGTVKVGNRAFAEIEGAIAHVEIVAAPHASCE